MSVAVTVTEHEHAAVGVPEITPVDELIVRPVGSPVAENVLVAVDEVSDAELASEAAVLIKVTWLPGLVTTTVLVMVQVKLTEFEYVVGEPLSVAVTVTAQAHAVVGVPLMTPADEMTMPAGRPVAVQVSPAAVATVEVSVATEVMLVMAVPDTFDLAVMVGVVTATVLVMFQVKLAEFAYVVGEPLSVAVRVTEQAHAVVGVPVTAPVEALIDRPVGRPVAVQPSVATEDVSVAVGVKVVMAVPDTFDLAPGLVTATVLVMVQVKLTDFAYVVGEPLSVAVTVTAQAHAVVGVPLMMPVAEAMERPTGRPVAVHVTIAVDDVSVAVAVIGEMAVPDTFDFVVVLGLVTATVLVMVQVNETAFRYPPSEAVMVTEQAHAVVGVPLTRPVDAPMVTPAGRPVADQVRAAVEEVSVAVAVKLVMAVPDTFDFAVVSGLVTATVLVMFQVKAAELAKAALSVAV